MSEQKPQNKKRHVLLIGDTSDQNNWGCHATSAALKGLIEHNFENTEILTINLSTLRKEFRQYKVPILEGQIFESFSGNFHTKRSASLFQRLMTVAGRAPLYDYFPLVTDDFDRKSDAWLKGEAGPVSVEFMAKVEKADAIIFNGEGAVYENVKKGTRPLYLMYLAKKYLKKPSFVVNHSAHLNTTNPILPSMVRYVYPLMDGVLVREPCSKENLEQLGVAAEVEVIPDALFSLDFSPLDQPFDGLDSDKGYICVGGSSLAGITAWRPHLAYSELVNKLKRFNLPIVLIAKDNADMFLKTVAEETGCRFFGGENTFYDLYQLFAKAKLYISGRYHPIIIAAMAGCPYVPLSANMHKIEGVSRLMDYHITEPYDFFHLSSEIDAILQDSEKILQDYEAISLRLKEKTQQLAPLASRNISVVKPFTANSH